MKIIILTLGSLIIATTSYAATGVICEQSYEQLNRVLLSDTVTIDYVEGGRAYSYNLRIKTVNSITPPVRNSGRPMCALVTGDKVD